MATIVAPAGLTDTLLSGTSFDDQIYGAQGNDTLLGYAGSDYLDGGAGTDSLIGGIGNDSYVVDSIGDVVVENAGEGTDSVLTYFDVDLTSPTQFGGYLANVENFTLMGGSALLGTGNALDNSILGNGNANTLDGGTGNDSIDGGGGNDSVLGGLGNDTLVGSFGNDTLDGGAGNDTLDGGVGNDCLFGGVGADSMVGGTGNDSFYVDNTGDVVSEAASQGTDYIYSSVDYTIPANVDGLVLTGTANLNATGGKASNDSLVGNAGNNTLTGLGGNDTLMGGEIIKSQNGGYDDTLGGNDTLLGGDGNDSLIGGPGVDSLVGGLGNDTYEISYDYRVLVNNTAALYALTTDKVINGDYVFQNDPSNPALGILWQVVDQTNLNNAAGYANTGRTGVSAPGFPSGFESTDVILEGAAPLTDGIDLVRSSATFNLATNGANVENLALIGSDNVSGTGNALDNVLTGNISNNSLDGGLGNDTLDGSFGSDTLIGGGGNDYYILNSETDDTTIELPGGGIDTVQTSVNFSLLSRPTFSQIDNLALTGTAILGKGNALDNKIFGYTMDDRLTPAGLPYTPSNDNRLTLSNDNQLSGGAGADSLYGGMGSDLLDGGIGNDMLIGGTNTIFGGASILPGGTDTDTLNGNDQLLGGAGADSLDGGGGNDIMQGGYGGLVGVVGTGDLLLGGASNDLLLGGTNSSAGATDRETALTFWNDTLLGGAGNDTLDGGLGTNSLLGGLGDDLVFIRSATDIAIELPGEGNDTLISTQNLDLSAGANYANFENAALFGNANLNLTGNDEANILSGNNGANIIVGNGGNDTLLGSSGLDYLWGDDLAELQSGNDCLDGGISASPSLGDTMDGGLGNDTYVVDNVNDMVMESKLADDGGVDTVQTYVNFDPLPAGDSNNVTRAPSFANLDIASFALLENFVFMDDTLRGVGVPIRGVGNAQGNLFTGNTENNVILGLGGDDTILGNAGDDSLYGDRDIETPVYDPLTGKYPSNPGAYDISSLPVLDQDLLVGVGGALENGWDSLVGGDGNDGMWGGGGEDTLIGGAGNDCLEGGADADSMVGGIGNDVYYVDNYDDVVIENLNEGTDIILRSIETQAALQDNVENLVIYGAALTGAGNDLDNVISVSQVPPFVWGVTLDGGAGNDSLMGFYSSPTGAPNRDAADYLRGGSGNDYLNGGKGADILEGGLGNDTLVVDNIGDAMREYNYEGNDDGGDKDLVVSSIDIDLSDTVVDGGMFIENLTMAAGTANLNGRANRLNNFVTGNSGDNYLDGEAGTDTILGGAGKDCLQGGLYLGLDDGRSDSLDGELGDDTYVVQSTTDQIHDTGLSPSSGEYDTILTTVSFSLNSSNVSGVEFLRAAPGAGPLLFTGTSGPDTLVGGQDKDTLSGLGGDDSLLGDDTNYGFGADDTIYGGSGNDTLNGVYGANYLDGGSGDDLFVFDTALPTTLDTVIGGLGSDTISLAFPAVTLGAVAFVNVTGVESLVTAGGGNSLTLDISNSIETLTGGAGYDTFDGSASTNGVTLVGAGGNDSLIGGSGTDSITGNSGADFIDGGANVDTLLGGLGNDTFVARGTDIANGEVINGEGGIDTIQTDNDIDLAATNNITGIENIVLLGGVGLFVTGTNEDNIITGTNTADIAGVPGDTLCGAGGNDKIYGLAGNDCLVGGALIDQLYGGTGNDSLVIDGFDQPLFGGVIDGGLGTDEVQADFTFSLDSSTVISVENLYLKGGTDINGTGDSGDNVITGNSANNILDGGVGTDTLYGGGGKDTLVGGGGIDQLFGESGNDVLVVDGADTDIDGGDGIDVVNADFSFSLTTIGVANVENLMLTGGGHINGTGDGFNNIINGNGGNNSLDGGGGVDQLFGNDGNDTLIGDPADAFDGGAGLDWISSSSNFDLLTATSVENLLLTGGTVGSGTGTDNIIKGNGLGNTLSGAAGNDTIFGGNGNNLIDGGSGDDSMIGGSGNDTYVVDSAADVIVEASGAGSDLVNSSVTYTLVNNLEDLTLTGTTDINGTGNSSANTITGNAGFNKLIGGAGNDALFGGAGNDTLSGTSGTGIGEIDALTGGADADTFVLGTAARIYYGQTPTTAAQYAVLTDFDVNQADALQLKNFTSVGGNVNGYVVGSDIYSTGATGNSYLYRNLANNGTATLGDPLIAAIQATGGTGALGALTTADLTSSGTFI
jgi:Ca2+-binding RTX toxin-like protein